MVPRSSGSATQGWPGRPGWERRKALAFCFLGLLLGALLFAASAPSPLYPIYQAAWHFSPLTLTEVYAAYAAGALAALLVGGRISDHVGRRPTTAAALLLQIAAMLVFLQAHGVPALFAARTLQGVATGIASSAINAWMLDLQPADDRRLGGLVSGIALIAGLGLGGLGSGLLAQFGPDPLHLVFWLLVGVYVVAAVTVTWLPDVVARRPGWARSMRPVVGVPSSARAMFAATAPSLVATWAIAGLYLALGPSLAATLLHTTNHVAGGLVVVALLGTSALSSFAMRTADPGTLVVRGSLVLIAGVGLTLFAVAMASGLGLYIGSALAGVGLGPAFSGAFRSLAALAPPDRRAGMLAVVYTVIYVSFSVPAIAAGFSVGLYGLRATTLAFGLVVMALAATTTLALSRGRAGAEAVA